MSLMPPNDSTDGTTDGTTGSLRFVQRDGSVPPRYHKNVTSTLRADGTGVRRIDRAYGKGEVTKTPLALAPDALAALWTDLRALGLFSTDWAKETELPRRIGGGSWQLFASHGGERAEIQSPVAAEQREASRAIRECVREALAAAQPS